MRTLTVIIPTARGTSVLERSLPHYLSSDAVTRIVVVADRCEVRPWDDARVDVFENAHTPGVPGARNTALDHLDGDLVLFGEDDAWPTEGAIDEMLALWRPGRLVAANLFEQTDHDQDVATIRADLIAQGRPVKKWRLGRTTDATPASRFIESGTTALVMGAVDELAGLRFDEGIVGPTFHLEDIDFQLQLVTRGLQTGMASRAEWIHLYRVVTGATGCRTAAPLDELIRTLLHNDRRVYRRHRDVLREHYGIASELEFLLTVTSRATVRRMLWQAEVLSPLGRASIEAARAARRRVGRLLGLR